VFFFGDGSQYKKDSFTMSNMKGLLGGKGLGLNEMSNMGLSVPPGFTITTEVCAEFHKFNERLPAQVWNDVLDNLEKLETKMNRKLGDPKAPLLVSIRSGAAISMPGMMDTVLNLGMNDEVVEGVAQSFGNARFAYDSYRRFLHMFGDVVLGIDHHEFEKEIRALKQKVGVEDDSLLTTDDLKALCNSYKDVYKRNKKVFPSDPLEQMYYAIAAVFNSWQSDRAVKYREAENIIGLMGTAVNVQAMVFGNMGSTSGSGVVFTRDPNSGAENLYGEFLENAQGEDVVAGIRTPQDIESMKANIPSAYKELVKNIKILEYSYHDMQDIEFTVQEGKLWMLQTRNGKRSGQAAIKIAVNLVLEGLATIDQAIMTVKPEHLNQLLHPQFSETASKTYKSAVIGTGLAASPGAAVGKIVLTPEAAEMAKAAGENVILVREDTSPEDVAGMAAADGILTSTGGFTSHASVVARGWGKPCICGCSDLQIDHKNKLITIAKGNVRTVLKEGDWISINGDTGEVINGKVPLSPPSLTGGTKDLSIFMAWVDARRKLRVLANADTPEDAREARNNGAQGIGLCRTEHMFFAEDRINVVRRMILSKDPERRQKALDELLVFQREDFEGILEAMDGLPVTIRLLDPPLHEFLPRIHPDDKVALSSLSEEVITDKFAADMNMSKEEIINDIRKLQEVNPMLGLRGCRLGITIPELTVMQVRALLEGALANKKRGLSPRIEIMIPLIGSASEFTYQKKLIEATAGIIIIITTIAIITTAIITIIVMINLTKSYSLIAKVFEEQQETIEMKIGTMIEVPRAALTSKEIAEAGAQFFSFGTNDLTQMTMGFSRDDVGSFLPTYLKKNILDSDPFETIDERGVGQLISLSTKEGHDGANRIGTENFKTGVCGEHGN